MQKGVDRCVWVCVCVLQIGFTKFTKGAVGGGGVYTLAQALTLNSSALQFQLAFYLGSRKKKEKMCSRAKKICREIVGRGRGKIEGYAVSIFAFVALQKKKYPVTYASFASSSSEERQGKYWKAKYLRGEGRTTTSSPLPPCLTLGLISVVVLAAWVDSVNIIVSSAEFPQCHFCALSS